MISDANKIHENSKAMERKHFLMRALNHKNITQEQYDKEMPALEKHIALNIAKRLKTYAEQLRTEVHTVKQTISSDGNMKRSIAAIIIKFLRDDFNDAELKGIFRQGYKIMRGN